MLYNVSNHWNSNVNLNYSFWIIHSKEILNFFFKWKRRNMEESRAKINNKQTEEKNWISPIQLSSFLRFKYPNCLNFSLPSSHKWERLRVNWLESSRLEINSTSSTRAFINVLKLRMLLSDFPKKEKKKKERPCFRLGLVRRFSKRRYIRRDKAEGVDKFEEKHACAV